MHAPLLCHRKDKSLSTSTACYRDIKQIQSLQLVCCVQWRQMLTDNLGNKKTCSFHIVCWVLRMAENEICASEKVSNCGNLYRIQMECHGKTLLSHQSSQTRVQFTSVNWDSSRIWYIVTNVRYARVYDKLLFIALSFRLFYRCRIVLYCGSLLYQMHLVLQCNQLETNCEFWVILWFEITILEHFITS